MVTGIYPQAMSDRVKNNSLTLLQNEVLGSHLIKNHIPGKPHLLSERFKKFLKSTSLDQELRHQTDISRAVFSPDNAQVLTTTRAIAA